VSVRHPGGGGLPQIAGVPPQVVLTTAPAALLAYALFGASRQVVVGSTSSIAILTAAIIVPMAAEGSERYLGLAADLPILVGALFVLSSLLRDGSQYPQPFVHHQSRVRDSGGWCPGVFFAHGSRFGGHALFVSDIILPVVL
jgi:hypothetical protein